MLNDLNKPKAVIVDLSTTNAFEMCEELSIPVYSFFTTSANVLAFCLYLLILDEEVEGGFVDLVEPVQVPGCTSVHIDDLVDQVRD